MKKCNPRTIKNLRKLEHVFIRMARYWGKVLKIGPMEIVSNPHLTRFDAYVSLRDNIQYLVFNPGALLDYEQCEFVALIFHELAHLKKTALYELGDKIMAEYTAEIQALKWLKKYFPKFYERYIILMKTRLKENPYKGKDRYYQKAFSKIKEYND